MVGLSGVRKSFKMGFVALIQYRRVTDTQPPIYVPVSLLLLCHIITGQSVHIQHVENDKKSIADRFIWLPINPELNALFRQSFGIEVLIYE